MENLNEIIFIVSTTFILTALVFTSYHYRRFGVSVISTLAIMSSAQLLWKYVPEFISYNLYDIAFIFATISIIRSRILVKKIYGNYCDSSKNCIDVKKNITDPIYYGRRWYDRFNPKIRKRNNNERP